MKIVLCENYKLTMTSRQRNNSSEDAFQLLCKTSGILEVLDESSASLPEHNPAELDEVLSKASSVIELPVRNDNRIEVLVQHDSIGSRKQDSSIAVSGTPDDGAHESSLVDALDQICSDVDANAEKQNKSTKESDPLTNVNTDKCEYPGSLTKEFDTADLKKFDYSNQLKSANVSVSIEKHNTGELMLTGPKLDDCIQLSDVSLTSGDDDTKIQDICVDSERVSVTVDDSSIKKYNTLGGLTSIIPCDVNVQFKGSPEELRKSSSPCDVEVEMTDSPGTKISNISHEDIQKLSDDSEETKEPQLDLQDLDVATKSNSSLCIMKECDDPSITKVLSVDPMKTEEVTGTGKKVILDGVVIATDTVSETKSEPQSETQKLSDKMPETTLETPAALKVIGFICGKKRTLSDVLDPALVGESSLDASDKSHKCFKADDDIDTSITGLPEESDCKQRKLKVCLLEEDEDEDLELSTDTGEMEDKTTDSHMSMVEDLEDIIKPHVLVASHKNSSSLTVEEKQMDTYESDSSNSLYESSGHSKQGHSYSVVKKTIKESAAMTAEKAVTAVDNKRKRLHTEWSESSNSSWESDLQIKVEDSYTVAKKIFKTAASKDLRKTLSADIKRKHFDEDWSDYSDSSWDRDVPKLRHTYTAVKGVRKDSNVAVTIENISSPLTTDVKENPSDIDRSDSSNSSVKISVVRSSTDSTPKDGNKSIADATFKGKESDNNGFSNSAMNDKLEMANSCNNSKSVSVADNKHSELVSNPSVEQIIKSSISNVYKDITIELTSDDGSNSVTAVHNNAQLVNTDESQSLKLTSEQENQPKLELSDEHEKKSDPHTFTIDPEESLLNIFDDTETTNKDSSIGDKITDDSVEALLSSLTNSVTDADSKKDLDTSDNKSRNPSSKMSDHPKVGLSYKRVSVSRNSKSVLKPLIDTKIVVSTAVNNKNQLGSTDNESLNSSVQECNPTCTDSNAEVSPIVEEYNMPSMKSGQHKVDNLDTLVTNTQKDLNKPVTVVPNSVLKQSDRSAVRRAYIPVYGIPGVTRVSLPMAPFVTKDPQRLTNKNESSNVALGQKELYKVGHSKFVVRATHSTVEDAIEPVTTAEDTETCSDVSKSGSSNSNMDHSVKPKMKRSTSLAESSHKDSISKVAPKLVTIADSKEKYFGIKKNDSSTSALEQKDQTKSGVASGRSRRGSFTDNASKDTSKLVTNVESFALEQKYRSVVGHLDTDGIVQEIENDPEVQVIEPEESLVKLFQETGTHDNDTTAITAPTTKESDDSVEDLILLLEDSPNTSRQIQTPTESPDECQIISIVDKTKAKESRNLRKQTRSVDQGRNVLTTRVRLQKVLEAAVKKHTEHTGQNLSLIKKQKKTKKITSETNTEKDLIAKGSSKLQREKVQTRAVKSEETSITPLKEKVLQVTRASKSGKAAVSLQEKVVKVTRSSKSTETSGIPDKKLVSVTRVTRNSPENAKRRGRPRKAVEEEVIPQKKILPVSRGTRSGDVSSNSEKLVQSLRRRPRKVLERGVKLQKKSLSLTRGTKSDDTTKSPKNVVTAGRRSKRSRKIIEGERSPEKQLVLASVKSEETLNSSENITHSSDSEDTVDVKKNKKSSPRMLSVENKEPTSRMKMKPVKDYRRKELRPCVVKLEDVAKYTPLIKLRDQKYLTGDISNKQQEVNRSKRNENEARIKNKEVEELDSVNSDIPRLTLSSRPAFTYRDLKRNVFQIDLPSMLWATQVETTGRFVSFTRMSSDSNSCKSSMDKGVMFESTCEPAVFFREKRIYLPVSKGEINSLEAVSDFLLRVHRVAFCVGGLQRGVFSKGCRGFVDVPNSDMRCSSCVAERKTVLAALNRRLSKRVIKPNTRFL